jgi:hypothetical protein
MPQPTNLHELKSLQGHLAYIRRFISNLSGRCKPFSSLMKKGVPFQWDQACQNAFDDIKKYLTNPPVLSAPVKGRPLILYTAAMPTSLGALLAQTNDDRKEVSLYYLSRTLLGAECNYPDIEKICLAHVFAAQKLRHYMLEHTIHLISSQVDWVNGQCYFHNLTLCLCLKKLLKAKPWLIFYMHIPYMIISPSMMILPDEAVFTTMVVNPVWKMYFDGACRKSGAGARIVFVSHPVLEGKPNANHVRARIRNSSTRRLHK